MRAWLALSGACGGTAVVSLSLGLDTIAMVAFVVTLGGLAIAAGRSNRFHQLSFALWVLAFAGSALAFPDLWISWAGETPEKVVGPKVIAPLVQLIMFGMGMTLSFADFARVARMPWGVLVGFVLQYSVMPLLGFSFGVAFGLPDEVAVGLILYGSCSGGTASNVITYLARGNVALSVTMTTFSTLGAPLMTPICMKILAGQYVPIEFWPMMLSILNMIVLPVLIGVLLNRFVHRYAQPVLRWLPTVAMLAICVAIALTVALSREELLTTGLIIFLASACHNAGGFLVGYWGGRLSGLSVIDSRTVAIEVGMQNGGMATGLAFNVLHSSAAALVAAVEGPWGAIAGCGLASYWAGAPPHDGISNDPEIVAT